MPIVAPGSLPSFRISKRPLPRRVATAEEKINPLASIPATRLISAGAEATNRSTEPWNAAASSSKVVMSRNLMPRRGKSGIVRICAARSALGLVIRWASVLAQYLEYVAIGDPTTSRAVLTRPRGPPGPLGQGGDNDPIGSEGDPVPEVPPGARGPDRKLARFIPLDGVTRRA